MSAPWVAAVLAFLAVGLGTLSIVLFLEWRRELRRQRTVRAQLQRLSEETLGSRGSSAAELYRKRRAQAPEWLRSAARRVPHLRDLEAMLEQAALDWSVQTYFTLSLGIAASLGLAALVATRSWAAALLAAALGAVLPHLRVRTRRARRLRAFEETLPEAIDLLGRALRAGHPLTSGLGMMAEEAGEPVAGEFRRVFEEQRFGMPLDESLFALADRVPLVDVRIFISAVLIQREVGGNLAEILDKLAGVIRARFTFHRQLRVITAQGRLSGYVLGALPVGLALMMLLLERESTLAFMTHPVGRFVMMGAGVMQLIGFLWIRKVVDIKM